MNKRLPSFILTLLLCTVIASPALAEVILTERNEYYPVSGIGKRAILEDMKLKAPEIKGDDVYPAYTRTDIKYKYTWGRKNGRCDIIKVEVLLSLTYLYPRLAQTQTASVQKWWDDRMAKFVHHEQIHGDISKRAAYELDRKLRSLKNMNCDTAKRTIKKRGDFILQQLKKNQKEYDRITQHGRKQERWHGLK